MTDRSKDIVDGVEVVDMGREVIEVVDKNVMSWGCIGDKYEREDEYRKYLNGNVFRSVDELMGSKLNNVDNILEDKRMDGIDE